MKITYQKTRTYKYKLLRNFRYYVRIPVKCQGVECLAFLDNGILTVKKGYRWDGSSGVADTKSSMLAALVHDCLYQFLREGDLDPVWRKRADLIYRDLCIAGGMSRFRAWVRYSGLRIGGGRFSKPIKSNPILIAP